MLLFDMIWYEGIVVGVLWVDEYGLVMVLVEKVFFEMILLY